MFRQIGSQLESLPDAIALNPANQEVTAVLGNEATLTDREAAKRFLRNTSLHVNAFVSEEKNLITALKSVDPF